MTTKIKININTLFADTIDALSNGEDFTADVLNRPLIQLGLNTGWLKEKYAELAASKEDKFTKKTGFNKDFGTTAGTVVEGNDPRLSNARTPLPHEHKLTELKVEGSPTGYIFSNAGVLEYKTNTISSVAWNDVTGKPSVFVSNIANVDGLTAALAGKANTTHSHTITQITGLRQELDYLLSNSSMPYHTHPIAEVDGLRLELDARANVLHSHDAEEIDNLDAYVKARIPKVKIVREGFTSVEAATYTLASAGQVFKVTMNGIDLGDDEWSQAGNILTLTNTVAGDRVLVYIQESDIPTLTRTRFTAVAGDNTFTLAAGVSIWQVSMNGIDIEEYTQTGTTLSIAGLNAGDIIIAYGNTGG